MKKLLVLVGAVVFVAAMASPSFAQTDWIKQFKATSLFQMWSVWESKYDFNNNSGKSATATGDKTRRGLHSRINFYLDWGNSKYVRGVIGFEGDSTNWGEQAWSHDHSVGESSTTGTAASNPSGRMGTAGTDQVQLEIKHAYLQFTIPNTPVMVTYGLQGFAVGGRLGQSRDLPGLIIQANFAPHSVRALWWREQDGYASEYTSAVSSATASPFRDYYHVNDTYGMTYDLAQKLFNVNVWALYKNDLASTTYKDNPYWIGVGGGFRPGNLALSGQVVYLGGKRDYYAPATQDQDFSAWAAEILASYQIGPGLSVALEGYYATGNDTAKKDKINMYAYPTGSESYANFGLGRSVIFFMNFSELGGGHNITGVNTAGYWYARLNAQYAPVKWLNLNFNYLYLNDTSTGTTGAFNTIGRTDVDKTFIGHELNVIAKLRIYQNFTWNIGLGALIPGEIFDHPSRGGETMYGINTGMQLSF
jgi:hypothetical protein